MSRNLVVRLRGHSRPMPEAGGRLSRLKVFGVAAVAGMLAAGCSADISRFDGQGFGLTDSQSATIPPQGMRKGEAAKLGDAGVDSGASAAEANYPPPANRSASPRVAALPEPTGVAVPPPAAASAHRPGATMPRAAAVPVQAKPIAAGATIEVAAGDTLYGIAKRHAVPVNELMTVNNLTSPTIKPGQKLVLPASRSIARARTPQKPIQRAEPVRVAAITPAGTSLPASPIVSAPAAADWGGTHTVKPGENLYGIARANKIPLAQLQQVNGITDPTKVKPGTVLRVPGSATTAAAAPPAAIPAAAPAARVAGAAVTSDTPRVIQTATRPVIINSTAAPTQQVAAVEPAEQPADAVPAIGAKGVTMGPDVAAAGGQKFRWPVKGRVIAGYGPRSDSTHNDGINIAVPLGAEVLAAEQGVVAYAGAELKGYGNLILLRHDSGWVTAYAHNEEILVKRGDKVKRGQAIAKAGKTGTVDQPQVHFEIRQGQKPVDPLPHMEKQ